MRTLTLPDDKLKAVLAALEHAGSSKHHPHCTIRKTMHCSCHVAKAQAGYQIMQQASRRHLVRASALQVGQWIAVENSLNQRIVAVAEAGGHLKNIDVTVDYGSPEPRAVAEIRTFGPDDEVLVIEPTTWVKD